MSRNSILALLVVVMTSIASAMTIEEFSVMTPDEKIKVLRGNPEQSLNDPRQLLRLYTMSLRDSSLEVRRAGAQAAALLVIGMQSAKPYGKVPTFSSEDSTAFQQALVSMLNAHDAGVRAPAASALAYSASPNPAIENLLLDQLRVEPVPEIKGAVIEAMAQAGYQSPRLIAEATALIQPNADSKAIYSASKVFAYLRPESALDTLIALASKPSPSQQHALQALAAYGQAAARAIPALESVVSDQTMPEDIRNLARITLEAVRAGKPQPSNLQPVNAVDLWPVAVSASSPPAPSTPSSEQMPASTAPVPKIASTPLAPITPPASRPATSAERAVPVWPWVIGIACLIVILALFAKRRG